MLFPGNGADEVGDTLEALVPRVVSLLRASTNDLNSADGAAVKALQRAITEWQTAAANAEIDKLAAQYFGPLLRQISTQELNHAAVCMLARPVNLIPGSDIDCFCAAAIRILTPRWLERLPDADDLADRPPESTGGKIRRRIIIQIADLLSKDPRSVELLRNMQEREQSWRLRTLSEIAARTTSRPICLEDDVKRFKLLEGLCKIYPPDGNGEIEDRVQITHAGTEVLQILRAP